MEGIADGRWADTGERRDVADGERAGPVLADLSRDDGEHRLLRQRKLL
jgi:hypothetical protein